jgi:nucleoside-diphosphate-sugar epimerase
MRRALVTGASGQIGSELTPKLAEIIGEDNVIVSDIKAPQLDMSDRFEALDITKREDLARIVVKHDIDTVFNLAALLSVTGEKNPQLAWEVNVEGLHNVFEVAREQGLRVFHPSSIAVFGSETPRDNTPQDTVLRPSTMYGVTKVTGELLGNYYVTKYGVDVRGIRFPGVISNVAPPGGGTTDYAVEMFYEAIQNGRYTCFLRADSTLPMIYMPDCLKSVVDIMCAEASSLIHHTDFNLASMSFSPAELAQEIKRHIPDFEIKYAPDSRQAIADSWPRSIDDSAARREWGWRPSYDLPKMATDMIRALEIRLKRVSPHPGG